ncbi:hypothetical protein M426DRAFT_323120 [Hypoxylon sp. CI-4A]|nr:hypothetical protein M426DRAFT_323120 [Hypoxylon sp. CI-4A]
MPSNDGFDSSFDDFSSTDQTNNPTWPIIGRFQQTQIENKYFEKGATIHFEKLPTLQSWAPLFFISDKFRIVFVTTKVVQASKRANRRLKEDEIAATSEAAANSARYFPYTNALSAAVTFAIAWSTRKSFKFPFYQPKPPKFDPSVFPMKRMPFLKGRNASYAWHGARFLCYFPLVGFGSVFFFSSLAETTFEARLLGDPRLRGMMGDIRQNMRDHRSQLEQQRGIKQRQGQTIPQSSQRSQGIQSAPYDQYPSDSVNQSTQGYGGDAFARQSENTFDRPAVGSNESVPTSTPKSRWSRNTPPQATSPNKPQDTQYPETGPQKVEDDSDLFDDDDASPVPASLRKEEAQAAQNAQGGSSWDRIRQQSQSSASKWTRGDSSGQERGWAQLRQDKTRSPRDAQPKTEGFAYSQQDEEKETRKYEKEQAQKEFDALLESERRGGSSR